MNEPTGEAGFKAPSTEITSKPARKNVLQSLRHGSHLMEKKASAVETKLKEQGVATLSQDEKNLLSNYRILKNGIDQISKRTGIMHLDWEDPVIQAEFISDEGIPINGLLDFLKAEKASLESQLNEGRQLSKTNHELLKKIDRDIETLDASSLTFAEARKIHPIKSKLQGITKDQGVEARDRLEAVIRYQDELRRSENEDAQIAANENWFNAQDELKAHRRELFIPKSEQQVRPPIVKPPVTPPEPTPTPQPPVVEPSPPTPVIEPPPAPPQPVQPTPRYETTPAETVTKRDHQPPFLIDNLHNHSGEVDLSKAREKLGVEMGEIEGFLTEEVNGQRKVKDTFQQLLPKDPALSDSQYQDQLVQEVARRLKFQGDYEKIDDPLYRRMRQQGFLVEDKSDRLLMGAEALHFLHLEAENQRMLEEAAQTRAALGRYEITTQEGEGAGLMRLSGGDFVFDYEASPGQQRKEIPDRDLFAQALLGEVLMDIPYQTNPDGSTSSFRQVLDSLNQQRRQARVDNDRAKFDQLTHQAALVRQRFYDEMRTVLAKRRLPGNPFPQEQVFLRGAFDKIRVLTNPSQTPNLLDVLLDHYVSKHPNVNRDTLKTKLVPLFDIHEGETTIANFLVYAHEGADFMERKSEGALTKPELHKVPRKIRPKTFTKTPPYVDVPHDYEETPDVKGPPVVESPEPPTPTPPGPVKPRPDGTRTPGPGPIPEEGEKGPGEEGEGQAAPIPEEGEKGPGEEGEGPAAPIPEGKKPKPPGPVPELVVLPTEATIAIAAGMQRIEHQGKDKKVEGMQVMEEKAREMARLQMTEDRKKWEGKFAWLKQMIPRFWKFTFGDTATYGKEKSHALKLLAESGLQVSTIRHDILQDIDSLARERIKASRNNVFKKFGGWLRDTAHELSFTERDLHKERIKIVGELRAAAEDPANNQVIIQELQRLNRTGLLTNFTELLQGDLQAGEGVARRINTEFGSELIHGAVGEAMEVGLTFSGPQGQAVETFLKNKVMLPILQAGMANGTVPDDVYLRVNREMHDYFLSPEFIAWRDSLPPAVRDKFQETLSTMSDIAGLTKDYLLPQIRQAVEQQKSAVNLENYVKEFVLKVNVGTLEAAQKGVIDEGMLERFASRSITNQRVHELYEQRRRATGPVPSLVPQGYAEAAVGRAQALRGLATLTPWIPVLGIGAGFGELVAKSLFRAGGTAIAPVIGGSVGAGIYRAFQEKRLFTRETEQHRIERELNYQFPQDARRRREMQRIEFHTRQMQSDLTNPMNEIVQKIKNGEAVEGDLMRLFGLIADTQARMEFGDIRGERGLFQATQPQSYQVEKTNLEIANASAKAALRKTLTDNPASITAIQNKLGITVPAGQNTIDVIITELTRSQADNLERGTQATAQQQLALGNLSISQAESVHTREQVFRRIMYRRMGGAFATTVLAGGATYLTGLGIHEGIEAASALNINWLNNAFEKVGLLHQELPAGQPVAIDDHLNLDLPKGFNVTGIDKAGQIIHVTDSQGNAFDLDFVDDPTGGHVTGISGAHNLLDLSEHQTGVDHQILSQHALVVPPGTPAQEALGVKFNLPPGYTVTEVPGGGIEINDGQAIHDFKLSFDANHNTVLTPVDPQETLVPHFGAMAGGNNGKDIWDSAVDYRVVHAGAETPIAWKNYVLPTSEPDNPMVQFRWVDTAVHNPNTGVTEYMHDAAADNRLGILAEVPNLRAEGENVSFFIPAHYDSQLQQYVVNFDPTDTTTQIELPSGDHVTMSEVARLLLNEDELKKHGTEGHLGSELNLELRKIFNLANPDTGEQGTIYGGYFDLHSKAYDYTAAPGQQETGAFIVSHVIKGASPAELGEGGPPINEIDFGIQDIKDIPINEAEIALRQATDIYIPVLIPLARRPLEAPEGKYEPTPTLVPPQGFKPGTPQPGKPTPPQPVAPTPEEQEKLNIRRQELEEKKKKLKDEIGEKEPTEDQREQLDEIDRELTEIEAQLNPPAKETEVTKEAARRAYIEFRTKKLKEIEDHIAARRAGRMSEEEFRKKYPEVQNVDEAENKKIEIMKNAYINKQLGNYFTDEVTDRIVEEERKKLTPEQLELEKSFDKAFEENPEVTKKINKRFFEESKGKPEAELIPFWNQLAEEEFARAGLMFKKNELEEYHKIKKILADRVTDKINKEGERLSQQIDEWEAQLSAPPKEQETQRIDAAKKEVFERAGKRTKEEMSKLIDQIHEIHSRMLEEGKGKLPTTIDEAEKLGFKEIVCEGFVTYIPKGAGELVIVGDLHGDFATLRQIIEKKQFIENMESDNPSMVIVFEGDYLDRGKKDVELMEALLELKRRYPKNVVLMKADHEVKTGVSHHDYPDRAKSHYGDEAVFEQLHDKVLDILPRAVFCGNGVVMAHGGPLYYDLDLKKLANLHGDPHSARTAFDGVMTWADPEPMTREQLEDNQKTSEALISEIDAAIATSELSPDKKTKFHGQDWLKENLIKAKKRLEIAAKNGFWFNPDRVDTGDLMDAIWSNLVIYSEKGLEHFLSSVGGNVLIRGHQTSTQVEGGKPNPFSKNILWTIHSTGKGSVDSHYSGREFHPSFAVFDRNQDIREINPTKNIIEVW